MTEGSTCYDVYTSRLLVGRKAVLDHFAAILARHGQGEKWEAEIKDMEVAVSGDVAVATYKISTKAEGAHMLAAVTHVFRRQGGRWLATHLHRSWNSPPPK
jgi:ketosteroid isomerase-like protein